MSVFINVFKIRNLIGGFKLVLCLFVMLSINHIGCGSDPQACKADTDCKTGEICKDGKCQSVTPECKVDADCKDGGTCKDGKCQSVTPECKVDADCKDGGTCKDGKCQAATPECKIDADCKDGGTCKDGKCQAATPECKVDADCKDGGTCKDGKCQAKSHPFKVEITLVVDDKKIVVDLSKVDVSDIISFEGKAAIRLTRVVEFAAIKEPWNYHYNFVAKDGFNVLTDKLENDYAQLPYFGELDKGYLFYDEGQNIFRIGWEAELNFPKLLNIKGMGGGTIQAVMVKSNHVVVKGEKVRALVDLSTLTTKDIVYYRRPEDGPKPMIALTDIFKAAGLAEPKNLFFKFYGKDGFSNNNDNLMPYEHATHTWFQPDIRRIIPTKDWDTDQCCWSVRDTVLITGLTK